TIAEPVCPGTNRKAIEAKVDILAHPGFISDEEVQLAKGNGVFLEITARPGHSFTNGHVAKLAQKHNASLVLNTDTHSPENLITREEALKVALGAGLSAEDFQRMQENSRQVFARLRK
ncbi:MAG: histidinol phosphate phosphatase domain-containing protein, partial [Deltaproteobacteria bacterium]|nr:histidinol phosphate phosphatase domain-containing protein [Deltaproteobacteria bacterium]